MEAYINDIAYYLPEKALTNVELAQRFPEWQAEKITSKVGIDVRFIAAEDETATDMAIKAAEKLFSQGIDRDIVDYVLFCTQSPDYKLPSSACIIQEKLGLSQHIGALDFDLGCSGFVYGLSLAKGLIVAGIAKNVLLLTAETYTKYLHDDDKGNRTIFGDGAAATLISDEGIAKIGEFSLGTNGAGANDLIVQTTGARTPEKNGEINMDYLQMNGPNIFSFTLKVVPAMVSELYQKNSISQDEVDLYVMHQANKYMLNVLQKKLKVTNDKWYLNLENRGNTVSSTIPIALKDALDEGRIKNSDKVLIAGFGVGLSWGGTLLYFE